MTIRDITGHLNRMYSVDVSTTLISNVTSKLMPMIKELQNRALKNIYDDVFLDAIHYNVRQEGAIAGRLASMLAVRFERHDIYNRMAIKVDGFLRVSCSRHSAYSRHYLFITLVYSKSAFSMAQKSTFSRINSLCTSGLDITFGHSKNG